jgi:DNA repair exonuclease SbcCD ATPase subunit
MRADGVAEAEMRATLAKQGYTEASIDSTIATITSNVAKDQNIVKTGLQTAGHYALATAAKVANAALSMIGSAILSILATKFLEWLITTVSELANFASDVEKSTENLNELKSEIESINKELETTDRRIKELNGKENLSFTEQEELDRLKEQNAELERELALKERLKNSALNTARNDAVNYFGRNEKYASDYEITGSNTLGYAIGATVVKDSDHEYSDQINKANAYLNTLNKLNEDIKAKEAEIANIKLENPDNYENLKVYKNANKELDALEKKAEKTESLVTSLYNDFTKYDDNLDPESDKDLLKRLGLFYDGLYDTLGLGESSTDKFNEIWNSKEFKNSKKKLEELSKAGKLDGKILEGEEYRELLQAIGKDAEETAGHINSIFEQEKKEQSKISFSTAFSSLPIEQIEKFVGLVDSGEITSKNINSFEELEKIIKETGISSSDAYAKLQEFAESYKYSIELTNGIQESYNALEEVKKEFKETKQISLDTLNTIAEQFPELKYATTAYAQGLITAEQ